MKRKILEELREKGLLNEEAYRQALQMVQGKNSLIKKYGKEVSIENVDILEILQNNILVLFQNKVYSLPLQLGDRELKIYYRSLN
mgnify:FL=1